MWQCVLMSLRMHYVKMCLLSDNLCSNLLKISKNELFNNKYYAQQCVLTVITLFINCRISLFLHLSFFHPSKYLLVRWTVIHHFCMNICMPVLLGCSMWESQEVYARLDLWCGLWPHFIKSSVWWQHWDSTSSDKVK